MVTKLKRGELRPGLSSSRSNNHQVRIITIVAIVLIAALIFLVIPRGGIGAGKAVQQTTPGEFVTVSDDPNKGIKFAHTIYFADPDDALNLEVFMKTDLVVNQVDYEVTVAPSGIVVTPKGCDADPNLNCGTIAHITGMTPLDRSASDPVWIVGGGLGVTGTNLKVFTIPFQVDGANVGDEVAITLGNVFLRDPNDATIKHGPLTATATVNVVAFCTDADGDGYGATNTELRACPTPNQGDCTDTPAGIDPDPNDAIAGIAGNLINPGRSEQCNGVDDDCDGQTDEGQSGGVNTNTRGVCWGTQVCQGAKGFVDSYRVPVADVQAVGLTPITFTDPDGTAHNQQELYNANTDACDFYDNDCDGTINEDEPNCDIGGGIVSKVPGNIYIDYDNAGNAVPEQQRLDPNDIALVEQMMAVIDDELNCGALTQPPCFRDLGGISTWICESGIFYQHYPDPNNDGNIADAITEKYSPFAETITTETATLDLTAVPPTLAVTCAEE